MFTKLKNFVQFTEVTSVSKEQLNNTLFDVLQESVMDNEAYCKELINKIIKLPYAKLPDFFSHHCDYVENPVKWLNKFEKLISENEELFVSTSSRGRMMKCYTIIESKRKELEILRNRHTHIKPPMQYINAECEERYFSFREVKSKVNAMKDYTEKIMFLTNEKFDYEQASIDFINPKLPDYSDQCQKEIDQIQHLIRLTDEFSKEQMRENAEGIPFNKLKINCKINQLVDIFYQLHRELFADGKPIIDGNVNDIIAVIVNSFTDKDGRDLSPDSIATMLKPSKTRLCFVSYDTDLYLNENASIFPVIESCHPELVEGSNSKTINEPTTIASNGFSTEKFSNDYLPVYEHCVRFTEKKESYINGNRNNFVHLLACNLNRKGVPLPAAMGYILSDYNYDAQEVTTTVNSAYKNVVEHNKSNLSISPNGEISKQSSGNKSSEDETNEEEERPSFIDKLENFLNYRYSFRYNVVTGKLEYKASKATLWKPVTDFVENSILREIMKAKVKCNINTLRNLLRSDFCEQYDPFNDYFSILPNNEDERDYITELANTITTTKQDLWRVCFKKWFVAMVACVTNEKAINQTVIVFSGKQGVGKTTWIEKLIPKSLKDYMFSGTINPNNKDTLIHLAECMLINLDELENLNRTEIGTLKELITKTHIRMRKAYGHNNETLPRRASFAGSVNTAQFLNDTTGSRRFLCFEVEHIEYTHSIDINLAYAQAKQLYKDGFRYWFNQEEIKEINQNNEQYQIRSPEEELLLTWFEVADKETANAFINTSQIAAKLDDKAKLNITDGTVMKLGKALKKHAYLRLSKKTGYVYAVRELTWDEVDNKNREKEPPPEQPKPPEQTTFRFGNS